MASDTFKALVDVLDTLFEKTKEVVNEVLPLAVDWSALDYSAVGAASLFQQFRYAGSWSDYIMGQLLDLEQKKNNVVQLFSDRKAQLDRRQDTISRDTVKKWVQSGYAYQERASMVRLDLGDDAYDAQLFERKLENLSLSLAILRTKAKQFSDFKADARVAASVMNFGHALGELR